MLQGFAMWLRIENQHFKQFLVNKPLRKYITSSLGELWTLRVCVAVGTRFDQGCQSNPIDDNHRLSISIISIDWIIDGLSFISLIGFLSIFSIFFLEEMKIDGIGIPGFDWKRVPTATSALGLSALCTSKVLISVPDYLRVVVYLPQNAFHSLICF